MFKKIKKFNSLLFSYPSGQPVGGTLTISVRLAPDKDMDRAALANELTQSKEVSDNCCWSSWEKIFISVILICFFTELLSGHCSQFLFFRFMGRLSFPSAKTNFKPFSLLQESVVKSECWSQPVLPAVSLVRLKPGETTCKIVPSDHGVMSLHVLFL